MDPELVGLHTKVCWQAKCLLPLGITGAPPLTPFMALLAMVSVAYSQPWSKNIKWRIPEINNL